MRFCPHCMAPADGAEYAFCPNCGGNLKYTGAENHLPVGAVLNGSGGLRSYLVGAARGQGGFGITYIALEQGSQKRVAVKEYYPTRCAYRGGDKAAVMVMTGQDEIFHSGLNSFLDEAKMLAAHDDLPAVVRVIDYFRANNTAYLVMEYVNGVPLHEQMRQMGGRLPARKLISMLPPLLRDLGQLHQSGVIHRDISPDNLMWMPDGSLKLLDFGCARSMEGDKSMTVLLKHGFAPIEQYRTRGQGPYTDVYALAATVYYCITGQTPPSAMDRLEHDTVQSPIALGADLTVQQETALLWALSVKPEARPQTMQEFANMLFATVPPPPPPPPPPPNPIWSKKPVLIAAAAVLLALTVGLVVHFVGGGDGKTSDRPISSRRADDPEPTRTPRPTPTPEPDTVKDENGYIYEILGNKATIIGYEGTEAICSMPDDIDGVPITAIGDGALAGANTYSSILLPVSLETIGPNAFRGCISLQRICVYSDVSPDPASFSGCTSLRCVHVSSGCSYDDWLPIPPDDCCLIQTGMNLEVGELSHYSVVGSSGEIYGITTDDQAVLLDVPAGVSKLDIPNSVDDSLVTWVCSGALHNVSSGISVTLGKDTCYSYDLQDYAFWSAPSGSLAEAWIFTCTLADGINSSRASLYAPEIAPDVATIRAAMTRANDLLSVYDINERPDGSKWSTPLTDEGIAWRYAKGAVGHNYTALSGDSGVYSKAASFVQEHHAAALTAEDSTDYAGKYLNRIGAAFAYDGSQYVWASYAILVD